MKLRSATLLIVALYVIAFAACLNATVLPNAKVQAGERLGRIPLGFVPDGNSGLFVARAGGYTISLSGRETEIQVPGKSPARMSMALANARDAQLQAIDPLQSVTNFYIGDDPKKWRVGVRNFAKVKAPNVYPGIDVVYYGDYRNLEFDFVVAPNANPKDIALVFSGAKKLTTDKSGNLLAMVGEKTMRFAKPHAYQSLSGNNKDVDASYVLQPDGRVTLRVGSYDKRHELVIDPIVSYVTYVGGSAADVANGIAVDGTGNVYITGQTCGVFPGQSATFGECDAYVSKLPPDGASITTSIFGGTNSDVGNGIALDATGNVYIVGTTSSSNLPATSGSVHPSYTAGSSNAFVARFSSALAVSNATYLGNGCSDIGYGIALDQSVPGATRVIAVGEACGIAPEGWAGVVDSLSASLNSEYFSEFIRGIPDPSSEKVDAAYTSARGVAVDGNGNIYLALTSSSSIFPSYQAPLPAGAFARMIARDGSICWTASIAHGSGDKGTNTVDYASAVAVDGLGNSYYVGTAVASAVPTSASAVQATGMGGQEAFLVKLNSTGQLQYGTYLSGSGDDQGMSVAVDNNGMAYVTGSTHSADFPIINAQANPFTSSRLSGSQDAFVAKVSPDGGAFLLSGYLGGNFNDSGNAVATDGQANIFVAGSASSSDFPIYSSSGTILQRTYGGNGDAFVAVLPEASLPSVTMNTPSLSFGGQNVGSQSAQQFVLFSNTGVSDVHVSSILASGDFSAFGSITHTNGATGDCFTGAIAPGETCRIGVTFTPTDRNARTGVLTIIHDAPGTPSIVTLSGSGTKPVVTLSPTLLNFGRQPLNVVSAEKIITLSNTGDGLASVLGISVTGDFSQTNNCGTQLVGQSSCTITVTATPTAFGIRSGTLSVNDDAEGSPHTVNLSVEGAGGVLNVNPLTLTFPAQKVGTSSTTTVITVTNGSTDVPLTVSAVDVLAGSDFQQTNTCDSPLAPAATCTISVVFTPADAGNRPGTLTITANTQDSPKTVALSGTGARGAITLTPATLTFSSVPVHTTATQKTTLSNSGSMPVAISSIAATDDFAQTNSCGTSLAAGASCDITVSFTPSSAGAHTGTLTVADDAVGSPHTVALSGNATGPTVQVSATSLSFSSSAVGTESAAQTVTLTNASTSLSLTVQSARSTGDFRNTSECDGAQLQPGKSCTVSVYFKPTVSGSRTGTLSFIDDGGTQTVSLSGSTADFSMTGPSTASTISAGGTATYSVALTPAGGFKQTVKVTCSGPASSACSVSPSQVSLDGTNAATVTVSVATRGSGSQVGWGGGMANNHGGPLHRMPWASTFAFGLFGIALIGRKRVWAFLLALVLCFGLLFTLSGCGGGSGSDSGLSGASAIQAGTYNIVVTASYTDGSGNNTTKTTTLQMIVQ